MCGDRGNMHMYADMIQLFKAAGIGVAPTIIYLDYAVQLSGRPESLDADAELVGRIAHQADVPLIELRDADSAGLEEMFLELTAETQRDTRKLGVPA